MSKWVIVLCVLVALVGCKSNSPSGLDTVDKGTPVPGSQDGVVERFDLATLSEQADTIVVGRVVSITSVWLDEAKSSIVTKVAVVLETIAAPKGSLLYQVTVVLPGGTMDGVTQSSEDAPQFTLNERVLLFLNAASDGSFKIVGSWQGKLVIENSMVKAWDKPLTDVVKEIRAIKES